MIKREDKIEQVVHTEALDSELERTFDVTLRPQKLDQYIGQHEIKRNLRVFLQASKGRSEPLEHVLLHGGPGLGKTTLANIIANEMGVAIKVTSGPALEKQGDVAALLTNLQNNEILFIDEIHRLKPQIEEILYTAMEDFAIDIVLGKGPSARIMRLDIGRFTLIGATTKMSMLSSPLRDRFGHIFKLEYYAEEDIGQILERSAQLFDIEIEEESIKYLAKCSRQTPRVANRLLRRVRDFTEVSGQKRVDIDIAEKSLKNLGVDYLGLDSTDRQILGTLIKRYKGGPVGLNTLSAAIAEEGSTLEEIYEPYLLQLGMIERTARGRIATEKAFCHLGFKDLFENSSSAHQSY